LIDARLLDLRAGALGALQEHVIQVVARVDQQRIVKFESSLAGVRRAQNCLGDEALGRRVVDQERILTVGLVSQSAAAGLFPGELFVEQEHAHPGRSQLLGGESSRRTAAQDGHLLHCYCFFAGGRSSGEGIFVAGAGAMPPP